MASWTIKFIHEFSHIFIIVLPYFIAGITAGAFLEAKANFEMIDKFLGKGKKSIISASILGAILPGCACATMPMAEGLLRKGAKMGTVTAFIMTSPLLAPQTIILTFALLGPSFTIARVCFGLLGGISIGLIVNALNSKNWLSLPQESLDDIHCCKTHSNKPQFFKSFFSIAKKLGGYLIIGLAIASALTVSLPENAIPSTVGQYQAYIIAGLIGIPAIFARAKKSL